MCSLSFRAKGIVPEAIGFFAHGTTITTNALSKCGAKVGLLITAGFRAIQENQNQARDTNPFDYFYSKPTLDRAAKLHRDIPERIDLRRQVLAAQLDAGCVSAAPARELKSRRCHVLSPSVTCFPTPHQLMRFARARILNEEFPEAQVSLFFPSTSAHPRMGRACRHRCSMLISSRCWVHYIAHLANSLDDASVKTNNAS